MPLTHLFLTLRLGGIAGNSNYRRMLLKALQIAYHGHIPR